MRSRFMILLAIAFVGRVAGAQAPANSNTASTPGRTEIRLTYLGERGLGDNRWKNVRPDRSVHHPVSK
jgi:hypothetical protein